MKSIIFIMRISLQPYVFHFICCDVISFSFLSAKIHEITHDSVFVNTTCFRKCLENFQIDARVLK